MILLDDEPVNNYTFRQNYYFMAGDHIFDSNDSRYWGLLPEDHIVGNTAIIWQFKSVQTGKHQWNRFFKTIK
jgi:signal peptidase I